MKNRVVAVILISILFFAISCKKDKNNSSQYTTPPVINLNPPVLQAWQRDSTPYADPGYTAYDKIDGDLTSSVVRTGIVNTNADGTYTLNYNVKDKGGLSAAQKTRTVIVKPFK
jgi:hypothetical protein